MFSTTRCGRSVMHIMAWPFQSFPKNFFLQDTARPKRVWNLQSSSCLQGWGTGWWRTSMYCLLGSKHQVQPHRISRSFNRADAERSFLTATGVMLRSCGMTKAAHHHFFLNRTMPVWICIDFSSVLFWVTAYEKSLLHFYKKNGSIPLHWTSEWAREISILEAWITCSR